MLGQRLAGQRYHIALPLTHLLYSLCPTTIVVLAQYLSDQVHKEVHVSSHIDVQVQTCNDAPGSELRRQRQRDGGSSENALGTACQAGLTPPVFCFFFVWTLNVTIQIFLSSQLYGWYYWILYFSMVYFWTLILNYVYFLLCVISKDNLSGDFETSFIPRQHK